MTTPSEELRTAAKRIREVAAKATPGPWLNLDGGDRIIRDRDRPARFQTLTEPQRRDHPMPDTDEVGTWFDRHGNKVICWLAGIAATTLVVMLCSSFMAFRDYTATCDAAGGHMVQVDGANLCLDNDGRVIEP